MKYFKIKTGYGENDFIQIDETELEMAWYCFITDSKGVFKNGVCRGKDIIAIPEDWHRVMGWNYGYKMGTSDWEELNARNLPTVYRNYITEVKTRVQNLIETNQTHLIGKLQAPEQKQKQLVSDSPPDTEVDHEKIAEIKKEISSLVDTMRTTK